MIKDEALSKIESESLFKHEAMKGVSEKEAPFFDRKFDEEVIHNKDEPNEQETSENSQDMQKQDAEINRNCMHSHSLAYRKETVKREPTSPFLREKETKEKPEKSNTVFDKSKTQKSKFQTESGKKFEVKEDLVVESMKRKQKANPKYTEKELRQKAFFIQKLKGAKSVPEKGSPDEKIAAKKFQKNLESKCKNQWYYEKQVKPFLTSVKYHIAQSLSYEDDQDFNGDENVLETTTSCNDKSLWIDDRMTKYPGTIYFGQNSGSWGNTGVAFYDDSLEFRLHNSTFMRLYKITRNQLHDVQNQECNSPNWYGRLVCLDILEDGCEVYTFTAETKQKLNEPSDVYANLIHDTLVRLGASHEFGIDNYIAGLSKGLEIKIREKGSRKNAEYNEKMNHLVKADCDMLIKASEQNSNGIVYKSELYAKDSMPVMPFRIVVEDTYDGEFRQVVVKRIEYHKIDGIIHEEITELNRSWWKE